MNKKVIALGALTLLLLSGCSEQQRESGVNVNTEDSSASSQQTPTTKDNGGEVNQQMKISSEDTQKTDDSIHFIGKDYTKGNIKVTYPQLGNADNDTAKTINEVIAKDATYFFEEDSYQGYSGNIEYDITFQSNEVASITYKGLITSTTSYPVHLFYSTIVNIQTGEKETLSDLVTIDNSFVNLFRQGEILLNSSESTEYENTVKKYITSLSNEELLNELSQADYLESGVYTYLTENSIVVILGLPHALGDYVPVELSKSDLNLN